MEFDSIVIETEVAAPINRVWQAWTETNELTAWLTVQANVGRGVGEAYELFWDPDHPEQNSTKSCTITALETNKVLAFTWKGPVPYADLMNSDPLPTSVTVTFRAVEPDRTIVRLEHIGWGIGTRWAEARAWQERAWQEALAQLQNQVKK